MRLSTRAALGIGSAAEGSLDRVELGDARKGLAGNRSWRRRRLALDLHKLAPQMRPAEGERPGQGVHTRLSRHGLVSLIIVAVDDAAIALIADNQDESLTLIAAAQALKQPQAMNGPTARCIGVNINHARRVRSGPVWGDNQAENGVSP